MNSHNEKIVRQIAQKYGTPYYLVYPERFVDNFKCFRDAFLSFYNRSIISYSFKTNYSPFILRNVLANDGFAEVVSDMEYKLALFLGFEGNRIILNGPIKREKDIYNAIKNSSIIHLDSEYEVDILLKLIRQYNLLNVKVGLRINMEINTADGKSAIQAGLKESRFGFTKDVLNKIIPLLRNHGVIINSLHGHTSSTNRIVENYQVIAQKLLQTCDFYSLNNVEYLDLGGSFFGAAPIEFDVSGKPTYYDYAKGITSILFENEWFVKHKPYLILEPGTSVVANTSELVTQIYQHKLINNRHFIVVDASRSHVRPARSNTNYPFTVYSTRGVKSEIVASIVGSTCMEVDVIAQDVNMNHYSLGDLIVFKGVGAYRLNMTPNFINFQCPQISVDENGIMTTWREKQTISQVLETYNLTSCK